MISLSWSALLYLALRRGSALVLLAALTLEAVPCLGSGRRSDHRYRRAAGSAGTTGTPGPAGRTSRTGTAGTAASAAATPPPTRTPPPACSHEVQVRAQNPHGLPAGRSSGSMFHCLSGRRATAVSRDADQHRLEQPKIAIETVIDIAGGRCALRIRDGRGAPTHDRDCPSPIADTERPPNLMNATADQCRKYDSLSAFPAEQHAAGHQVRIARQRVGRGRRDELTTDSDAGRQVHHLRHRRAARLLRRFELAVRA